MTGNREEQLKQLRNTGANGSNVQICVFPLNQTSLSDQIYRGSRFSQVTNVCCMCLMYFLSQNYHCKRVQSFKFDSTLHLWVQDPLVPTSGQKHHHDFVGLLATTVGLVKESEYHRNIFAQAAEYVGRMLWDVLLRSFYLTSVVTLHRIVKLMKWGDHIVPQA